MGYSVAGTPPADYRLAYSHGEHAEERLFKSVNWSSQLPATLATWTPHNNTIVTAIVINRSPCPNCTRLLVEGLDQIHGTTPSRPIGVGSYWPVAATMSDET